MKKISIYFYLLALVALVIACDENIEPTPTFRQSEVESLTVTPSASSVGVTAEDSLDNVLTLTWNDPGYAVGLENTTFTVKVAPSGSAFSSFQTKSFEGATSGDLTGKDLNGMSLRLGADIGEPIELDMMVTASHANGNEPIESNVITVTVTPYADLGLTASEEAVEPNAGTPNADAITFDWGVAFNGFNGVRTYVLEYAKAGTSFANVGTVEVSGLSKTLTHIQMNDLALGSGLAAGAAGDVEFRIKATNELGTVVYSNVVTVSVTPYVAYNAIGIIGDATAGGWGTDSDLYRPSLSQPAQWTGIFYLEGGKSAKFRADDSWTDNWGASSFPSGTGTKNGANIPVSNTGYYKVDFNAATGAYTFTPVSTTNYTSVSLIGAQSGWGSDIADLTQDPNNNQIWTGTIALTAGELKFRANHDWGTNWGTGTSTSLSGYAANNGGNMVIPADGTYFVYINTATKEYFFGKTAHDDPYADIGIIGDATAGGWSSDTNLTRDPSNLYKWSGKFTLTAASAKFRANNDWAVNWGNNTFPSGIAIQDGPNIPTTAGVYFVTFNTATGEYTFTN
jgi:hypothetical protein